MNIKTCVKGLIAGMFILGIFGGCGFGKGAEESNEEENLGNIAINSDGMQYQTTKKTVAEALEGRTICIDPGHQAKGNPRKEPMAPGSDIKKDRVTSGTAGAATRIPEYRLTLEMGVLVKDKLEKLGAHVVMTRESHDVDISNIERAEIANDSTADLAIRIHADGAVDSKVRGASVLYPGNGYIKDEVMISSSKKAAENVAEKILALNAAVSVKTVERDDLTGFNWSKVPVILVEMGFMSNPDEDRLMQTEGFKERMSEAVVKGVEKYFEDMK